MSAELSAMFRQAAEEIEDAELERLRSECPGWRVWRSHMQGQPAGWVATNLDPASDRAPTLHGDTAGDLEKQLRNPPPRWAKPLAARGRTRDR